MAALRDLLASPKTPAATRLKAITLVLNAAMAEVDPAHLLPEVESAIHQNSSAFANEEELVSSVQEPCGTEPVPLRKNEIHQNSSHSEDSGQAPGHPPSLPDRPPSPTISSPKWKPPSPPPASLTTKPATTFIKIDHNHCTVPTGRPPKPAATPPAPAEPAKITNAAVVVPKPSHPSHSRPGRSASSHWIRSSPALSSSASGAGARFLGASGSRRLTT